MIQFNDGENKSDTFRLFTDFGNHSWNIRNVHIAKPTKLGCLHSKILVCVTNPPCLIRRKGDKFERREVGYFRQKSFWWFRRSTILIKVCNFRLPAPRFYNQRFSSPSTLRNTKENVRLHQIVFCKKSCSALKKRMRSNRSDLCRQLYK